ncbi:hypothetical protein [Actinacidiphila bryophytorum]|uniref:hypothetical protein n=1 Tax=Actinacidiphila bryophytorum TaxID=1436133 RepID=UPI00396A52AD
MSRPTPPLSRLSAASAVVSSCDWASWPSVRPTPHSITRSRGSTRPPCAARAASAAAPTSGGACPAGCRPSAPVRKRATGRIGASAGRSSAASRSTVSATSSAPRYHAVCVACTSIRAARAGSLTATSPAPSTSPR